MDVDKDLLIEEGLNDEVIISSVLNPHEPREETNSDEEAGTTHITWNEAFHQALDTFVKFAESSRFYETAKLMNQPVFVKREPTQKSRLASLLYSKEQRGRQNTTHCLKMQVLYVLS